MTERETCPRCGDPVLVLDVVDDHRQPTGEQVMLDPVPSLHGYYQRPSLYERIAVQRDDRRPGWYRPHLEHCGPRSDGESAS